MPKPFGVIGQPRSRLVGHDEGGVVDEDLRARGLCLDLGSAVFLQGKQKKAFFKYGTTVMMRYTLRLLTIQQF